MEKEKYSLADSLEEKSQTLYNKLPLKGKPSPKEWTVLATIAIIKQDENTEWKVDQIVALGTGNRCLSKSQLVHTGDVIHDSHAEVIARRSFLLFLHKEIEKLKSDTNFESKILEPSQKEMGKWRIRSDVRLGMYSSHTPCGDANIFEGGDEEEVEPDNKRRKLDEKDEKPTNSNQRDLTTPNLVRRKPGRGEHTLSVSCSDKIAMWNAIGIQGALLSLFLEPIFLSYFVIGEYFDSEASRRALVDRIPQHHIKLEIYETKLNFSKGKKETAAKLGEETFVSSGFAIGWTFPNYHEVTVSGTGRKMGLVAKNFGSLKFAPTLSKLRFLDQTLKKMDCKQLEMVKGTKEEPKEVNYLKVKEMGREYRESKTAFLSQSPFDKWTRLEDVYSSFPPFEFK